MKSLALLSVVFLLQKCFPFHYTDQNGVNITYDVTFVSKCRTEAGRFRAFLGIGLSDCVRECGLRPHCEALSYMRQMQMCNLFTTANGGNLYDGDCFSISVTDIKVEKKPCGNCSKGQVCDRRLKDCKYEECLNASINNGVVLGNRKEVGKKIRYKCNHGYRNMNGVQSAVCQDNGEWNVTANCTRVCNYLPTINNGTIALDKINGNMYMDTATVTCDTGYLKSVDTINCTATGDWENATCDPIVCNDLPTINNGDITLYKTNGNKYMDTATVVCDSGYLKSVDTVKCTASGDWEHATCNPVDCGDPPFVTNGTVVLDMTSGTTYMETATVTCDAWYQTRKRKLTCLETGKWESTTCADCYLTITEEYAGKRNWTVSGTTCQRWDSQNPHRHNKSNPNNYPEETLRQANNYCRNGNRYFEPWCFTVKPSVRWEFCGITKCQ